MVLAVLAAVQIFAMMPGNFMFFGKKDGEMKGPVREASQEISSEPEKLYAQSAVLIDADSGRILFGKNERKVRPMASTTKIMTCILTLENMKEGQKAKVSDKAARQPKVHLGVRAGRNIILRISSILLCWSPTMTARSSSLRRSAVQ